MALTNSPKVPLYILAGGQSSRFGSDKALALLDGQPLIVRVAGQFRPAVGSITVVAERAGKFEHLGLPTLADACPGLGPIGGLLTALQNCPSGWLLLAACDALVLDTLLLGQLLEEDRTGCQAIAFKGPQWEPMPALYHTSAVPLVRAAITQGCLSMWRLIAQLPHRAIVLSQNTSPVAQINTPEALATFRAAHPRPAD